MRRPSDTDRGTDAAFAAPGEPAVDASPLARGTLTTWGNGVTRRRREGQ